jgi:hypothetical protein
MKYFVLIFVLFCGCQLAASIDIQACANAALKAVERSLEKADEFENWQAKVQAAIDEFTNRWNVECPNLAKNDPPSIIDRANIRTCQANSARYFRDDIVRLSNDLQNLAGATADVVQDFRDEILRCLSSQN